MSTADLTRPAENRASIVDGRVTRVGGGVVWCAIPGFSTQYQVGPMKAAGLGVGDDVLLGRSRTGEWWVIAPAGDKVTHVGNWRWTNATGAASAGQLGIDAASWAAAAHVNVAETTDGGADLSTVLGTIGAGTGLYVQEQDDATRWARYSVTGAGIDQGAYRSFPVTLVDGSAALPQNNRVVSLATISGAGGGGGAQGPPGPAGRDGEKWWLGAVNPNGTAGALDGDLYLRTDTGGYWEKVAGAWVLRGSLVGPAGAQGPAGAAGAPGAAGAQGPQGNPGAAGAAGAAGSKWYDGQGAPASGLGVVGDFYLDTASGAYYEKTGAAAWTQRGQLATNGVEVARVVTSTTLGPTAITTSGNGDSLVDLGSVTTRAIPHYFELNVYVGHNNAAAQTIEFRLHEGTGAAPSTLVGVVQATIVAGGGPMVLAFRFPFTPAAGTRAYSVRWRSVTSPSPQWTGYGAIDPIVYTIREAAIGTSFPPVVPVGGILIWPSATPPTGYALCNGASLVAASYPALAAVIPPVSGNIALPDLRDRFVVGAGSTYALGATGGVASVTLTAAQSGMPSHTHTASSGTESADHTHTLASSAARAIDQNYTAAGASYPTGATYQANHTSPYYITGMSGRSAVHTHAITVAAVAAVDAQASHENRPPYYALYYVIRVA